MKDYYYNDGENQYGPFSIEELKSEKISKSTMIWTEDLDDWQPAIEIVELKKLFNAPPPIKKENLATTAIRNETHVVVEKSINVIEVKNLEKIEKTHYTNSSGIRITSTRLIIGSSTYPVNGVTAVHTQTNEKKSPLNWVFKILIIFAVFLMMSSRGELIIPAVFLICITLYLWGKFGKKVTYSLIIQTLAGEIDLFESENKKYVQEVYAAINNAIIERG
jgi:Family of unknown function (DUF6232)/GYF domain 2